MHRSMKRLGFGTLAMLVAAFAAPAFAQVIPFGFVSLSVSRTVITQDPDILLSVNVRARGTTRSLAGINNKKGVHCLVADVGRLELIPIPASRRKPLEIIGGGYTTKNTGSYKDWPRLESIDGNIGCSIDLEDGRNGDRFLRMFVLLKNGRRVEHHWLFGGTAKEGNLEAESVFSFHVLSVRDGEGNLRPWHLFSDGRTNYDSIVETLMRYGTGLTPGSELVEGRDQLNEPSTGRLRRPNDRSSRTNDTEPERGTGNSPSLVFTSSVSRFVMVQWLTATGDDGPQDKFEVVPGQESVIAVRQGYPAYDVYARSSADKDWLRVLNNGQEKPFPTPTTRRRMPFDAPRGREYRNEQ